MKKQRFIEKISVPATAETHPQIYRAVERFAHELGVAVPKIRIVVDQKAGASLLGRSLAFRVCTHRMEDGGKMVLIGNRFLRSFKKDSQALSAGITGLLAHEVAHVKHDLDYFSLAQWRRHMPALGVAAGLAAMGLYQYYTSFPEAQKALETDIQKSPHEPRGDVTPDMGLTHAAVVAAQYAVAGALGLAAGRWARKASSHFIEFRADRIAAELTGDGDALAQILKDMRDMPYRRVKQRAFKKLLDDGVITREGYSSFFAQSKGKDWWSHPPLQERIRRLEAWEPTETNGLSR